jgi:hypothetical protein
MKILINKKIEAEWNGKIVKCKGCLQDIGWAKTEKGKMTPFDLDENRASHWETCPVVGKFRKGAA